MSTTVLFTLLRYVLTLGGGMLVSRGYVDGGTSEAVIGAVIAAGSAGYGSWTSTREQRIKAAAKLPEVTAMEVNGQRIDTRVNSPMSDNR